MVVDSVTNSGAVCDDILEFSARVAIIIPKSGGTLAPLVVQVAVRIKGKRTAPVLTDAARGTRFVSICSPPMCGGLPLLTLGSEGRPPQRVNLI